MPSGEDLERLRRSVAMLAPGQPSGLSREEAMALLAEHRAQRNSRGSRRDFGGWWAKSVSRRTVREAHLYRR